MEINSIILATASYLPEKIIFNHDLKQFSQNIIPLIEQKTGVISRRFADQKQCTSDIATIAAKRCLENGNIDSNQLDGIILATSSPDRIQPATATRIQHKIGASNAFAFDINSVCSGGIFALQIANSMIKSGQSKNLLVIAADIYSKYLNPQDFTTFPYFGDGAGAMLLSASTENKKGILHTILKTDGSMADIIQVPAGGTMIPYNQLTNNKDIYFKMIGREVYNFAVNKGAEIVNEMLSATNIRKEKIRYYIFHQANKNIIYEICNKIGLEIENVFINLDKYGNTASASVFIALDECLKENKISSDDVIMLVAFGGGLSWGACLIKI